MLGLILDQNYNEPLFPIHSGPLAGPTIELMGRSHDPLGYYAVDDNPLGFAMPETNTLIALAAVGAAGLFLWKHKTGKAIVRKAKGMVGLGRSRRRRRR